MATATTLYIGIALKQQPPGLFHHRVEHDPFDC
jgi:hypothetical protein